MLKSQKTTELKPKEIKQAWWLIDLNGKVLGRTATRIADLLRGKHKASFSPHIDNGDFVVVINAEKVKLTGEKLEKKEYHRHTGYPGGIKTDTARELLAKHPDEVLVRAVKGMLPKNFLSKQLLTKLKIYAGGEHPHRAQEPKPWEKI